MPPPPLTPRDRGLAEALRIQKTADPREWRARVDAIPDPAERQVAEEYLRGIVARMNALRALRKGQG